MNPRVSVIVPVYRVEAYLPACVNSILGQTFGDYELILVDDGSPDGCPALCDAYAAADERVRVIHKANGGLSDARNAGLDAARGGYISFVDADDELSPQFLACLTAPEADIAQCGFCTADRTGLSARGRTEDVDGREMALRMCRDDAGAYTVVWNKLWRRELLGRLRFPAGKQHEDEFFSWRAYQKAGRCAVTAAPLYYYRQRAESIMDGGFSVRSLDAVEALTERTEAYRAAGDEELAVLTEAVLCHRLRGMMPEIVRALPEQAAEYRRQMRRCWRDVMASRFADGKKKLSLSLQMLSPAVYSRVRGTKHHAG